MSLGLRFPDKKHLAFRNLVQVPKVWSVFIRASFLVHVPQVRPFFILLEFCAKVDNSSKLSTLLCSGFLPKPSHGGFGQFFSTGTYTGIGTTCVEFEML